MSTHDLFGARARDYARIRPSYPEALFDHLERLVPVRGLAWDCGTGSGQTARSLARRFALVIASDTSRRQLAEAKGLGDRVRLVAAAAEAAPIRSGSVDLVTVSAALHWFDLPRFFAEVERVARPGAILAAWSYFHAQVDPAVDAVLVRYAEEVVGPFWHSGLRLNRDGYGSIELPFARLEWPDVSAEANFRLADLERFLRTWSASLAWEKELGTDPVAEVADDLRRAWGDPARERRVRWPLHGAIARVG